MARCCGLALFQLEGGRACLSRSCNRIMYVLCISIQAYIHNIYTSFDLQLPKCTQLVPKAKSLTMFYAAKPFSPPLPGRGWSQGGSKAAASAPQPAASPPISHRLFALLSSPGQLSFRGHLSACFPAERQRLEEKECVFRSTEQAIYFSRFFAKTAFLLQLPVRAEGRLRSEMRVLGWFCSASCALSLCLV